MNETMIKTHLIIDDIHEEFFLDWVGKVIDTKPLIKNNKPVFIIRSNNCPVEVNTGDLKHLETIAKKLTSPRGRESITTDRSYIYIKEIDGNEVLLGIMTHNHIKHFLPMYDKVYEKYI